MEQQPPCGQFPQTVLPLLAPHVPSVVMAPVGGADVGAPRTGSACDDEGATGLVTVPPVVQPLWHPCALSQLVPGQPRIQHFHSFHLLRSSLSTPPIVPTNQYLFPFHERIEHHPLTRPMNNSHQIPHWHRTEHRRIQRRIDRPSVPSNCLLWYMHRIGSRYHSEHPNCHTTPPTISFISVADPSLGGAEYAYGAA